MKKLRILALVLIMVFATLCISASAADQTARLKSKLQTDILYFSVSADTFTAAWSANSDVFITRYDEMNIVLSGTVGTADAISLKQLTLSSPSGRTFNVNTSDIGSASLSGLKAGDTVTVYGKVYVTPVLHNSFRIDAAQIDINAGYTVTPSNYYFYPNKVYSGVLIDDMAVDGHVKIRVPSYWLNDYVGSLLTNNGIHGHQFTLNAITPRNLEHPEIFYIFYFDCETYLEKPPVNATTGDYHDIETAIVKNILQNLEDNFSIKISDLTTCNGRELHYCTTTYKPTDGKDYRLEFLFLPDADGITVMLYLYYPSAESSNHLSDVAYVIETLETDR